MAVVLIGVLTQDQEVLVAEAAVVDAVAGRGVARAPA